ncbi:MAG: Holliday junction resolvase RuvX [Granulosicoccaceae bacterium]
MGKNTLLGFDFGERRIGLAIGDRETGLCSPLATVYSKDGSIDWAAIKKHLEEWQPAALVVGVPRHMDGSDSAMTTRAAKFGRQLHGRFALPVFEADERTTSRQAESILRDNRGKGRRRSDKGDTDKIAAALILQHWIEAGGSA